MLRRVCSVLFLILLLTSHVLAGTTGKIAGRVKGADTGEPLVGVSILIEGTTMGASTDVEGEYVIMNIPPDTYTVVASGVGLQKKRFTSVKVSVDFTTRLDIKLSTDVIALETVEVQAEAPMIRRDLTSSHTNIDAASIEALPVESVTQILSLQAGSRRAPAVSCISAVAVRARSPIPSTASPSPTRSTTARPSRLPPTPFRSSRWSAVHSMPNTATPSAEWSIR